MPSECLTPFEHAFRHRLRYTLGVCNLKNIDLAREYSAKFQSHLSGVQVSHWLCGRRAISPRHYPGLKSLLTAHLKSARATPEFGLEQELMDWDGLVFSDEQLERRSIQPKPVILGNLIRSRPGAGHFYRKTIRDEIALQLLNPDPESGIFRSGVAALTGLPGSGRSEMVLEVLERVAWFFNGGILFADLSNSSNSICQDWGGRRESRAQTLVDIERIVRKRSGRWLLVAENVVDGKKLQAILPSENIWVLATAGGISAFQPLGWEEFAFPLPPLSETETTAWLKRRLGEQWGKPNDKSHASELRGLIEGQPMAMAILAALVRSRGWQTVFDALYDQQRAVSFIRFSGTQETPTSSLSKAIDIVFLSLSPAEKTVLQEMALYLPGSPVPEIMFNNLLLNHQDVVHELVEKGLLSRLENPHLRTTELRMHRLMALYARTRMPIDQTRLLERMLDFSAFFHLSLPEGLVAEVDIVAQLYTQRQMLNLVYEFWRQLGESARTEGFEPGLDVIIQLNANFRTGAYLTWMNMGAQAAVEWMESIWQIPFLSNFPEKDWSLPETRSLWADILFELRNSGKLACNSQSLVSLMHPQFFEMGQAGKSGNTQALLSLCADLLAIQKQQPHMMRFLWINRSLQMLFQSLWEGKRYSEVQVLAEQTLPFFMALPWRAGLEVLWWDFKATLAAQGQVTALMKLKALCVNERRFQDALSLADLSYTPLAEALLKPLTLNERVSGLAELAAAFKRRSLPEMEQIALSLAEQIESGQFAIHPDKQAAIPVEGAYPWLDIWPLAWANFRSGDK